MKTSELTGPALDWAVARCEHDDLAALNIQFPQYAKHYPKISPSTDWAQGGPILGRERICLQIGHDGVWLAYEMQNYADEARHMQSGPTPLIAAMRCYVASKLGEDVSIPEELK